MKLIPKKLYVVPYKADFRLGRFIKADRLSCQLHGEFYANVYHFAIKPSNPKKPWKDSSISIQIDCDENTPTETIMRELFVKIKIYDPKIHGKTEEEFNKIFNANQPIT